MDSMRTISVPLGGSRALSAEDIELRWYTAYTNARHEKRIAEQLMRRSVEHFLPVYETVHRWKDRRVRLQLPLFPCYIFVRVAVRNHLEVLRVPGVVRLVGFNGRLAVLPETEMLVLRRAWSSGLRMEPHPYLTVGRIVRVRSGPLSGLTGRLVRKKQNCRIVISIESIMRSVIAEVSLDEVEVLDSSCGANDNKLYESTRLRQ
jgi:transcription antitermination factor NusG